MRLDALVRLIEAADFMSFRELALHCLSSFAAHLLLVLGVVAKHSGGMGTASV